MVNPTPHPANISGPSARRQILGWYLGLLALALLGAFLFQRALLLNQLDNDVNDALEQEAAEMRALAAGNNPETGEPFSGDVEAVFTTFLSRNVPLEGEAVLTLVDGEVFNFDVRGEVLVDLLPIAAWANLTSVLTDELDDDRWGPVRYMAVPLISGEETRGVFVVAMFMESRLAQMEQTARVGALVFGSIFVAASVGAWVAAGRVLRPLRSLTQTARSISESDLSRRIDVHGEDEISELGRTFNSMLDRLQSAFELQREFVDNAGHELRTPITIIRGQLEVMGDDPEERREVVSLVTSELDRMSRIVDDLLVLATADQPDFVIGQALNLTEFTHELVIRADSLSNREWQLDLAGSGEVFADPMRLTQAMMNLIHNALEYTDDDVAVALGSRRLEESAELWVRDEGGGIAQEDQNRIFERFVRGASTPHGSAGAGLGLSIVKAIAEAHGGSVAVRSTSEKGTTFIITLPLGLKL